MAVRLGRFMEHCGVLPTTQFAYRKRLGTCDALLCVSHTLQSALKSGQEARIVQIDFSAAFDQGCTGKIPIFPSGLVIFHKKNEFFKKWVFIKIYIYI